VGEQAVISLGSNIEPERYLPEAVGRLHTLGRVMAVSAAYRNPAVGPEGQPDFVNAAVLLETDHPPKEMQRALRHIETRLGRKRTPDKFAPRVIDLDLVLYGAQVVEEGSLRLPDPDLLERVYLAIVAAEVAPAMRHPITGERLAALAERLAESAPLVIDNDITSLLRARAASPPAGEAAP
jgi:2-amino-4-hydroxy-6-hydroxymethyldihydropteridine diphosphokinase